MPRRPVNQPYTITTEFGEPDSNARFGYHSGVDYAVPLNRPIYAPANGQLTNVDSPTGGNMVVINDGQYVHRLMHNNSFSRGNGGVGEGEQVALAGTTGLSTGVHCHWDINNQGTYPTSFAAFINPSDWLTQGGQDMIPNADVTRALFRAFRLREPSEAEIKQYTGGPYLDLILSLDKGADREKAVTVTDTGKIAIRDKWGPRLEAYEAGNEYQEVLEKLYRKK